MDRGVALGRLIAAPSSAYGLAWAFDLFMAERAYRSEESGAECAARVEALVYGALPRTLVAA